MNKKFTRILAALALLVFMMPSMAGWGQANVHTSGDGILPTSSYKVKIGENSYTAVKFNKGDSKTITIPAGTTKLYVHAATWKGDSNSTLSFSATGVTFSSSSINLIADDNISGTTTTYDLNCQNCASTSYFFELNLSGVSTETSTTVTLSAASGKRPVVWGINAVVGGGSNPTLAFTGTTTHNALYTGTNYQTFTGTYSGLGDSPTFGVAFYSTAEATTQLTGDDIPTWLSVQAYKSNNALAGNFSVSLNEGGERHAYFKVYSGETYSSNVYTVNQEAAPTPSITITGTGITNNAITLDYNDQTAHTATVTYYNMTNPESNDVMVDYYDDADCTIDFSGGWFEAGFANNSVTSIQYNAKENNSTPTPRTVYMRVETFGTGSELVPCDVIAITQAGVPTYTVTYDNNGGSGTMTDPNSPYIAGATVTVLANTFTKEHYTFDKWNTKADGSGTGYVADNTFDIDENTTLYAQWTGNTHTVTLPTADTYGNYTMDKTNPVAYGTEVTLTYTPAEGYEAYSAIWSVNGTAITGNKFNMPDADVTVTVSVTEAHGTAANPYTVAEARAIINQGAPYPTGVYVSGIVTHRYNNTLNDGKLSYYISDNGEQNNELEAYKGLGLNGDEFTSYHDIEAGDIVVVYGDLKKYNTTYELDEGNYLYSWRRPATLTVSDLSNVETFVFNAADQNTLLLEGEGSCVFDAGDEVMISVSAESGYILSTFTVNGVDHLNDIVADAYTFTINQNTTVTATAVQAYNINYSVNGVLTQAQVPGSFQLPTSANLNSDEFVFAGWTTNPNVVTGFSTAGTTVNVQGGETFYAVYGKTIADGPATTVYQKVTSEPSSWEGEYLIVSTGTNSGTSFSVAFDGSKTSLDVAGNYIDNVIINNNVIESTSALDAATFTIAAMTGGYSIQSKSGYYIGRTASSNGMNTSNTTAIANDISMTSTLQITGTGSNTGAKLQYLSTSGSERFRYYTSSQKAIQLFKKTTVTSTTTTYYTRVYINETAAANMTIAGPSIIPSGSTLNMGTYALYNTNASNLIIEDGGQLISNSAVYATVLKNIDGYSNGGGWNFVASPIFSENGLNPSTVGMITTESDYDLYRFNPNVAADQGVTKEWENYKVQAHQNDFMLDNGHGYLYANEEDVILQFSGVVNSPDAVVSYDYDENSESKLKDWHLVGNPYMYEAYPNMSYYVVSGFGIAEPETSGAVAPCEGIMIQGTDGSVDFTRTPANNAQPSNLKVTLAQQVAFRGTVSSAKLDKAIISFNEGSQLSKFYFGESAANIYIPQDGKDYAIISSEAQGEMPVNFKANENGTYTLSIDVEGMEMNYLHLIDNKTGNDVDLLQTPSYSFEAKTTDYESRFKLVFVANNEDSVSTGTETFAFFSNGSFVINNEGNAELQVIDITGRIVKSESINGCANVNVNAAPGVYMLRLVNGDNVKTQKVVVK